MIDNDLLRRMHDAWEVFCSVFGTSTSWETFQHKHLDNPELDPDTSVFLHYQGECPCGANLFMSYTLVDHGKEYPVAHSCDTCVLSECRGQHVFSRLIQQAISRCQETKNELILATPNDNSYPGFKKLHFHEVGQFMRYVRIQSPLHLLIRKATRWNWPMPDLENRKFPSRDGFSYQLSLDCPFTQEDLRIINERPSIHIKRSREFYLWKVDKNKTHQTAYLSVRQNDALCAFFILSKDRNPMLEIIDWWFAESPHQTAWAQAMVHDLRQYGDLLSVAAVNPLRKGSSVFLNVGFQKRASFQMPFLLYSTNPQMSPSLWEHLTDMREWELRHIDFDTILN